MDLDYAKLGFRCGIEIHQQLDTNKLFCSCPPLIRDDKPDIKVTRRMRAVAGETGDFDPAALHEFLKNRELVYEAYSDSNCLVELDEEPPHPLNGEALEVALTVSLMLSAKPVSELQVMRKTVIDGSNTSGFQRTVLVALDGVLDSSEGTVGIPAICLEEDAARIIEDKGGRVVYRLDRLGIPLVEVGTSPDIVSPAHAREVAEKLGMILRATGKAKRGLGTIRQDLNVSIRGGERIEVKGVQDLRLIPKVVENEARRQVALIEMKKELAKRDDGSFKEVYLRFDRKKISDSPRDWVRAVGIQKGLFDDITQFFSSDDRKFIKKSLDAGEKVWGMRLPLFAGILAKEIMPGHRFGTELSHIVKSSTQLGGIMHSDEKDNSSVSEKIAEKLGCKKMDAWVAVIGDLSAPALAFIPAYERCHEAFRGVPKEVRRALPDGTTSYMRPLPGSHRMYPETDEPPINVEKLAEKLRAKLPKLPQEKQKEFEAKGLSGELAGQLLRSSFADEFMRLTSEFSNTKPSVIAQTLSSSPKEAKKRYGVPTENLSLENFEDVLSHVDARDVTPDAVVELLRYLAESPEKKASELIAEKNLGVVEGEKLKEAVSRQIKENKELAASLGARAVGPLTGKVLAELGGRARPDDVKKLLEEELGT